MVKIKLTPIRYRRSIYWWAVVLLAIYGLQVSNYFLTIFTEAAKEYLDLYSYVLTFTAMLLLWTTNLWRADNTTARALSRKAFYWINFIIFANLSILLYVNNPISTNTSTWIILGLSTLGIISGIIAAIMGYFNIDIIPEKSDETDINKTFINNYVYLWASSMLAVFYAMAVETYFNYLNETLFGILNILCLQGAVFFLLSLYEFKTNNTYFENDNKKRSVSRTIMPWMYNLSISLLLFFFVVNIIPQENILSQLIVCISLITNSIFALLLIIGKFNKQ